MTGVLITRCVCRNFPFDRLLSLARNSNWLMEELVSATGCGDQCGLCLPYLRAMLDTGTTEFRQLLPADPVNNEAAES